jgi:hypothetical protein
MRAVYVILLIVLSPIWIPVVIITIFILTAYENAKSEGR